MNMVISRQTKILLRESRTVEATPDDSVVAITQFSTVVTSMAVHVGRNKLGQLEMEATWTLIMGPTLIVPWLLQCIETKWMLHHHLVAGTKHHHHSPADL
uniref:Uncharacterized protein n=1 Tax=Daphnia galeata TaxID=27404 RepID=A0A8J2RVQ2_9CRUS|nr:unnamed protein product [Daphnia galeata]